jgi:hypothetical protein
MRYLNKSGFGSVLEGLFSQSNYGIVTSAAISVRHPTGCRRSERAADVLPHSDPAKHGLPEPTLHQLVVGDRWFLRVTFFRAGAGTDFSSVRIAFA